MKDEQEKKTLVENDSVNFSTTSNLYSRCFESVCWRELWNEKCKLEGGWDLSSHRKKFTPEPSEEVYSTVDTVSFRNFNQENFPLNFAKFSIFQKTKPTLLGYIGVPATPTSSNSLSLMMIKNTSRQPRKIKLLWGMKAKATGKKKLFSFSIWTWKNISVSLTMKNEEK